MEPAESIGDTNLLMKIIQNNPYRLLGVFSNSPLKERLANNNKLKAFLKVGKEASIPLDRIEFLPHLHRTEESVSSAEAMLTLPADQIKYAQFWFIKQSPLDEVAFNHLLNGETEKALSIWAKKDYVSSLQNRAICALMQSDVAEDLRCFTQLYNSDEHLRDFVIAVTGDDSNYSQELLTHSLLDTLCEESDVYEILPSLSDTSWKEYVGQRTVTPLIQSIEEEITLAKKTKGEGCTVRLNAGNKLKNATRENLQTLKQLLPVDDIRYQMIADKLGIEILQCGIDYYNGADATDAARNAMILQKYALSIVVGKLAKDRCQGNVNILQKIIDNLPPKEVAPESAAIEQELHNYCKLPDKIEHAVTLLNNCKPHLKSIKNKLGANNAFYLKISTKIAGNALHNLIEEVNEAQDLLSGEDVNNPLVIIKISYIKKKVGEGFAAIAGMEDLKKQLQEEVIEPLLHPEAYKRYGITIPNGMLLYGPPGCGKTFFAKHFAEEVGFNFICITPATLKSRYVNTTQENIAKMLEEAEQKAPTIIFIDEINELTPNRENDVHEMSRSAVNEMLAQMDRTGEKLIFIVGASNYPSQIDPAILRAGRLDRKYYIGVPDFSARKALFKHYLKNRPYDFGLNYEELAQLSENYVSADIQLIINDASRKAMHDGSNIMMKHLKEAILNTQPSLSKNELTKYDRIRNLMMNNNNKENRPKIGFNA